MLMRDIRKPGVLRKRRKSKSREDRVIGSPELQQQHPAAVHQKKWDTEYPYHRYRVSLGGRTSTPWSAQLGWTFNGRLLTIPVCSPPPILVGYRLTASSRKRSSEAKIFRNSSFWI